MTGRYSVEEIDADSAALAEACAVAEEALALHREALALIAEGWFSESGTAATDLLHRQCAEAAELVAAMHETAGELRSLRDALGEHSAAASPTDIASRGQAYGRLNERPAPRFEIPATPPPQFQSQPPVQPFAAWTPGGFSMPDLGGTLAGLVAQIAGAASQAGSYSVRAASATGSADSIPVEPGATGPTAGPEARPAVAAGVKPPTASAPPAAPKPLKTPVGQAKPSPSEPPLLAAERPPQPGVDAVPVPDPPPVVAQAPPPAPPPANPPPPAPPPVADTRTPCEIAADELPQVGQ